ncbi:hypothetical protein [Elizabethkingia meningoseptica]|uniref:hypothetical protein n=1 Tax=Elizabethkingia meningoseptica TaxID=238 RepID=UPI0030174F23
MWKIKKLALILLFGVSCFCYSQNQLKYVKIGNIEGKIDIKDFKLMGGEAKYMQLLKEFENNFSQVNNRYNNYYRYYSIIDSSPRKLVATLFPKNLVPAESKRKQEYLNVPSNTKIFKVYYNMKTKEIDGIIETKPGIFQ